MNFLLWADPNVLNPNLPEPYSFIDSIIRGVVSDALDEIARTDAADLSSNAWERVRSCVSSSQLEVGDVVVMTSSQDGAYTFVGNVQGIIHVIDQDRGKIICSVNNLACKAPNTAVNASTPISKLVSISISMYPPPLPFVTALEGSTNRRTPCWLTIAVASMSICNVYRVSTLTWQFQQCFSFDLITFRQPLPCNYNLPIPISMLRAPIETGEIMPLIMENISLPLVIHSVTLSPEAVRLAISLVDGSVLIFNTLRAFADLTATTSNLTSQVADSTNITRDCFEKRVCLYMHSKIDISYCHRLVLCVRLIRNRTGTLLSAFGMSIKPGEEKPITEDIGTVVSIDVSVLSTPLIIVPSPRHNADSKIIGFSQTHLSSNTSTNLVSTIVNKANVINAALKESNTTFGSFLQSLGAIALLSDSIEQIHMLQDAYFASRVASLCAISTTRTAVGQLLKLGGQPVKLEHEIEPRIQFTQLLTLATVQFISTPSLLTLAVQISWTQCPFVHKYVLPPIDRTLLEIQTIGVSRFFYCFPFSIHVVPAHPVNVGDIHKTPSIVASTPEKCVYRFAECVTCMTTTASITAIGLINGSLILLDTKLGCSRALLERQSAAVSALWFYGERFLCTGALDGSVRIFDLQSKLTNSDVSTIENGPVDSRLFQTQNISTCYRSPPLPAPILSFQGLGSLPVVVCSLLGFELLFLFDLASGILIGQLECDSMKSRQRQTRTLKNMDTRHLATLVARASQFDSTVKLRNSCISSPLFVSFLEPFSASLQVSSSAISTIALVISSVSNIASSPRHCLQPLDLNEHSSIQEEDENAAEDETPIPIGKTLVGHLLYFSVIDVICSLFPAIADTIRLSGRSKQDATILFSAVPQAQRALPASFAAFSSPASIHMCNSSSQAYATLGIFLATICLFFATICLLFATTDSVLMRLESGLKSTGSGTRKLISQNRSRKSSQLIVDPSSANSRAKVLSLTATNLTQTSGAATADGSSKKDIDLNSFGHNSANSGDATSKIQNRLQLQKVSQVTRENHRTQRTLEMAAEFATKAQIGTNSRKQHTTK